MSKNHELDDLKRREQAAFQHKQAAWNAFAEARDRASAAHAAMESAWQARIAAREEMNREFEAIQQSSARYRGVWDEYGRIRDAHSAEIERLRSEADYEHQEMVECFERASDCYESGSKAEAPYWSQQGREHQERRNDLNEAISQLCQAIKAARNAAESRAPKTDASAFHGARTIFQQAKSDHEAAQAEFKRLKAERDRLKAEFDSAQAEHIRLKDEFQRKLEAVKAERRRARDQTLDRANIRSSERADAKIITKPDGTTQIYHGGLGKGDGIGHGHTVLDQSGHKTYDRDAFAAHGHQNFTYDPANPCKTLAVGTDLFDGKPAKVRPRKDGRTDIFFVDSGNYGDGIGHGHVVLDKDNNVVYMRDPWQDKTQGQYLIDDSKTHHTKE